MQNITIGRYKRLDSVVPMKIDLLDGENTTGTVYVAVDVADVFDGWIEGVRDDGSTWIMWLDSSGNPTVFYPQREESGAVIGDPIDLS